MPYPRTYKVIGPVEILDTKPGGTFTLEKPPMWKHNPQVLALNEQAWIDGGLVKLVEEAKLQCEACKEQDASKAKQNKQYSLDELQEHYEKDHPGLVPPREG